jgi:hypothetical protein
VSPSSGGTYSVIDRVSLYLRTPAPSRVEPSVTSAGLSWNKAPTWDLRPDLLLSDSYGFVQVGRSL